MPRIEQSVQIEAPIEHVYRIARDVEAFPQFMPDLQSLTVQERSPDGARTVTAWAGLIREFNMTVKWTQEDLWNDAAHRDDFRLLQGDMDRMEGSWQFTSEGPNRTRFDSVVDYDYNVPLIGPMVKNLIKKKMTDNLQATMEAIKRRSEETT
ncbi:MAG TPA: SRPBCC family protein [Chthonomonadaceae bacterium]|nr:SRPBCC family protein [Chthonomonadaceae bacterium]